MLLWFGIGALIAITGIGGLVTQVAVFLIVSVLLTIASRTIPIRTLQHHPAILMKPMTGVLVLAPSFDIWFIAL